MKTVWKFSIPVADECTIAMPKGATVLHVAAQAGTPCLWALVDSTAELEPRGFSIRGTGHDCAGVGRHVGSFLLHGGALVFHLFEAP